MLFTSLADRNFKPLVHNRVVGLPIDVQLIPSRDNFRRSVPPTKLASKGTRARTWSVIYSHVVITTTFMAFQPQGIKI